MSELLIILSIIGIPVNFLIWIIKGKKILLALSRRKTWGVASHRFLDLVIDVGGTLFIAVLGGGGLYSMIIGSLGGLVLTLLLFIFNFTPRN